MLSIGVRVHLTGDHRYFLLDQFFDGSQVGSFLGTTERHCHALGAGPPGPPNPVHVSFRFDRDVQVDHVADPVDVDAPGSHIRGDQHAHSLGAEVLERALSSRLRLVAMDHRGTDALADQLLGHDVGSSLGLGEDQCLDDLGRLQNLLEQCLFSLSGDQVHLLLDRLDADSFGSDVDADRVGEPVTVALGLYRADGTHVASINSGAAARAADDAGTVEVDYAVDSLAVQPGIYELSVALHDATMRRVFERHTHLVRFEVEPTGVDQQNGLVALGGTWSARSADR